MNFEKAPFVVDAELLKTIELAESGNLTAILELSDAYAKGKKAPVDNDWGLYYDLQLARNYPSLIPWNTGESLFLCYSSLFSRISYLYASQADYYNSLKWLKKSLNYAKHVHAPEIGNSFIKRHEVIPRLKKLKTLIWQQRLKPFKLFFEDLYIKIFWNTYTKKLYRKKERQQPFSSQV